ncbi:MAG: hypothetical protein GY725_08770 [bacterium]|nr:hypothetical protein [bacterium]
MLLIGMTGMLAGALHVVFGADHLASLAPFSIEARRGAWAIGLRWGVGHALGLLAVGLGFYALADLLDLEVMHQGGDYVVGLVLVGVGLWSLNHLRTGGAALASPRETPAHVHTGAALLVGGLHGIAGTASVFGVLPALGMDSWVDAVFYLGGFATGTIGAMTGMAALLGVVTLGVSSRTERAYTLILGGAGLIALFMGVVWMLLAWQGVELHGGAS